MNNADNQLTSTPDLAILPSLISRNKKVTTTLILLIILSFSAIISGLLLGTTTLSPFYLLRLFSENNLNHDTLIIQARLPRVLIGLLAGMSLAMAGCVMQALTRNPLADPGLLGVNAGANASIITLSLLSFSANWPLFWLAIPGALLTSVMVYLLSRGHNQPPTRLILSGAAISAVLGAYVQARVIVNPSLFSDLKYWMSGSLSGLQLSDINTIWPYFIIATVILLLLAPALNLLSIDRNIAISLGANLRWQPQLGWLGATILCAASTATVGSLTFVGLASAHLSRFIAPQDFRWQLPISALIGGNLVVIADVIARTLMPPTELITGIVVAMLGAPFLYLAVRRDQMKKSSSVTPCKRRLKRNSNEN